MYLQYNTLYIETQVFFRIPVQSGEKDFRMGEFSALLRPISAASCAAGA